jgi:hypothetical protein
VAVAIGIPGAWLGTQLNERLHGDVLLLGFSVRILTRLRTPASTTLVRCVRGLHRFQAVALLP